jgi:putative endopeptidase
MRLVSFALLASTVLAGPLQAATPTAAGSPAAATGKPTYGSFGLDTAGMDTSVKPGNDFYDYANGNWDKTTPMPADRARYGVFDVLNDLSLTRTRGILEDLQKDPSSKPGMLYASFMDEAAANQKGAAPIKPWIAEIKAAKTRPEIAAEMAKLQRVGVKTPFSMGIGPDDKAPDTYAVGLGQSGLGLPDRDYYLKAGDAKIASIRAAYVPFLAKLLTLAGEPDADARAGAVMAFETKLAQVHWTRIESRDADKTYNKWTRADFEAKAPGFPWNPYLAGLGIDTWQTFLVSQPSAVTGEAKVIAETPVAVLQDYAILRTISAYAKYLSSDFVDANFAFNGTVLAGTPQNQPRWKRGVAFVSAEMGEAVGPIYVQRYFPPEAKAAADQLVRNIIAAFGQRIQNLAWMAPETKQKALAKLAAFHAKIGYPDTWRDYSALTIAPGDLVGNESRAQAFEYQRNLNKLGKPIDRGEWDMTPMTINAYANPVMNEVVFPAAILQPPFFDPKADSAVNYGGIGAVIGHELSHHFDDQGRKYDPSGKLADWWTPDDVSRFTAYTDRLVQQFDAYKPLPGTHIQGGLTLGENMADLAGLPVAHDAWTISLGGKPAPVIDGFTGDQRFYLGFAQIWRSKYRDPALLQQLTSDPHSPGRYRVYTVRNMDAWYKAFDVKPGDTLYLAPAERVQVW